MGPPVNVVPSSSVTVGSRVAVRHRRRAQVQFRRQFHVGIVPLDGHVAVDERRVETPGLELREQLGLRVDLLPRDDPGAEVRVVVVLAGQR